MKTKHMKEEGEMLNFVMLGVAGFVAPRHLKAIKAVGGNLLAAMDPHDSVGVLDSYFPNCAFFTEFERFDRYCDKLIREGIPIDFVTICSPNYLHDAHCRFALRNNAEAICEKPLVINTRNIDSLIDLEKEFDRRINCIMQLRLHPDSLRVKTKYRNRSSVFVNVEYNAPRGLWYNYSWKGIEEKSGGLATNIGIHIFDLLAWFFGKCEKVSVLVKQENTLMCNLRFERSNCEILLSTEGDKPVRIFQVGEDLLDFTQAITNLHTLSYEEILNGNSFRPQDAREGIRITELIREF